MLTVEDPEIANLMFMHSLKPYPDIVYDTNSIIEESKKEIGSGGLATIFSIKFKINNVEVDAVLKEKKNSGNRDIGVYFKHFFREMEILNQLHHPGISKLLGWRINEENGALIPCTIIEKAETDLKKFFLSPTNPQKLFLPTFVYGIVNALIYQHNLGIVHKDIKTENVLVVKRKSPFTQGLSPKLSNYFEEGYYYYPLLTDYNVSDKTDKITDSNGQINALCKTKVDKNKNINYMKTGTEKSPEQVDSIELLYMVQNLITNNGAFNSKLDNDLLEIMKEHIMTKILNGESDYKNVLSSISSEISSLILNESEHEKDKSFHEYMEIQRKVFKEYVEFLESNSGTMVNQSTTYLSCKTWENISTPAKFEELMAACKIGNFDALITAGLAFQYGLSVPKDIYNAIFLFAQACNIKEEGFEYFKNAVATVFKFTDEEYNTKQKEFVTLYEKKTYELLIKDAKLQNYVAEARLGIILAERYLTKKDDESMKNVAMKYLKDALGKVDLISIKMAIACLLLDDKKYIEAYNMIEGIDTREFNKLRSIIQYEDAIAQLHGKR
jgi:serine/threonine protein kinase